MKRIVIPNPEEFIAAVEDEIFHTREGRYYHRLHVILHVLRGFSCYEAAQLYGDSPRSVEYWIRRLLSDGLVGLKDRDRPGRPPRLPASELQELRKELLKSPRDLGYDQNLWDGVLLSHHLKKCYGVSLGARQCQRLFHQLGFSPQRPRRKPREAEEPAQQEAFKETPTN